MFFSSSTHSIFKIQKGIKSLNTFNWHKCNRFLKKFCMHLLRCIIWHNDFDDLWQKFYHSSDNFFSFIFLQIIVRSLDNLLGSSDRALINPLIPLSGAKVQVFASFSALFEHVKFARSYQDWYQLIENFLSYQKIYCLTYKIEFLKITLLTMHFYQALVHKRVHRKRHISGTRWDISDLKKVLESEVPR